MSFGVRNVVGGFSSQLPDELLIPYTVTRTQWEHRQLRELIRERLVTSCPGPANATAAEVGCGYGRNIHLLSEFWPRVHGFERDHLLAELAQYLCPYSTVRRVETLGQLPIGDGTMGFVLSYTVLQHLERDEALVACREIRRIAASGGFIVLCEETNPENRGEPRGGAHGTFPRHVEEYEALLEMRREFVVQRVAAPGSMRSPGHVMIFRAS